MGNAIGKKRKLGTASSAKWVAPELQVKKDGLSPLARSYSMPVNNAKSKSDNYHVVALTGSTYGILKVDLPKDLDESCTSMSQSRAIECPRDFTVGFQKMRKFEIPEVVVPKPWSDEMLSNFKLSGNGGKEGGQAKDGSEIRLPVHEEEPEIIYTWEMMAGLEEDFRSPSPLALPPMLTSPKSAVLHKKVKSLDTSLSFSATHNITEVDVKFLEGAVTSELKSAVESDTLIKGKCYTQNSVSHTSAAAVATFGKGNVSSQSSSRHPSGRDNAVSSPTVPRDASFSSLPATWNSSVHVTSSGTPLDSKGSNNRISRSGAPLPRAPIKIGGDGCVGTDAEIKSKPVKSVQELPDLKVSSSVIPKFSNLSLTSKSTFGPSSPVRPAGSSIESVGKSPTPQVAQNVDSSPFSFANTVFSTADNSENQFRADGPLFDPELLASFDVSEDEWYRVRRSDAGIASTSGSSSEGERSPLRPDNANLKSSAVVETSPLARIPKIVANSEIESKSRKMFTKVAPVDFRDVVLQKVRKADPFETFEKRIPPGGENRVVIYVTSLRGIRKTFEDCSHMKLVILGYRVAFDERDVSMHAEFRQELKDLMGMPVSVPRLFIKGHYIGGAEEVSILHDDGILGNLLDTMPAQTSWEQCDGCGGHRFVPCSNCRGSCKLVTDDNEVVKCTDCNENGLVRCPICF